MVRPTKGKERSIVLSFCIPGEYEYLIKQLDRLSFMDNKSRGEMILSIIDPYLREHFPGNPQIPLFATNQDLTMTEKVSLSYIKKTLESLQATMANPKVKDKSYARDRLRTELLKAAKVYDRTKDPELLELIEKIQGDRKD